MHQIHYYFNGINESTPTSNIVPINGFRFVSKFVINSEVYTNTKQLLNDNNIKYVERNSTLNGADNFIELHIENAKVAEFFKIVKTVGKLNK